MDEEQKLIRAYIWRFIRRTSAAMFLLWLICYTLTEITKKPISQVVPPEEAWVGYDPSRPVTDIKEFDYVNRRVTYRTYREPGAQAPRSKNNAKRDTSSGVTITTSDGRIIRTGLSYEELFEQLELEYEDLYEYYVD